MATKMTREEAINIVRNIYQTDKEKEALATLIPELAESEDERIRKWLIELVKSTDTNHSNMKLSENCKLALDWLEKQKEQKHPNGCFTCDEYKKGYEEGRRNGFTAGYNKAMKEVEQKEQKPVESISQLTVQGKGVYKICPRCKERMVRDDSMVYTSMPPQYRYECPKCGEMIFDTVIYDSPVETKQKPEDLSGMMVHKEPYIAPVPTPMVADEQKPEWSEEDENVYKTIMDDFNGITPMSKAYKLKAADWLKSLRPSWKPSEEQMKALDKAIPVCVGVVGRDGVAPLESLYEQLKKLM